MHTFSFLLNIDLEVELLGFMKTLITFLGIISLPDWLHHFISTFPPAMYEDSKYFTTSYF